MKRFIVAILILVVFLAGSITSLFTIKKQSDNMLKSISELRVMCEEDNPEAHKLSTRIISDWEKYRTKAGLLVHSQKLVQIQADISRLPGLIENDSDETLATIDSIYISIQWIYDSEVPKLSNIL